MRTKVLLAAVALAAGLATTMAQTFSQNVVGYVNKTLNGGGKYTSVANPLDTTNNTIAGLGLTALPNNSIIKKWDTNITDFATWNKTPFGTWSPDPSAVTLAPGEGILVYIAGASVTNTFVGEVLQGSLDNSLPAGYQQSASKVPQAATLSALGLTVPNSSTVYKFNSTKAGVGDWDAYNKTPFGTWSPSEPSLDVAESMITFLSAATPWVRNFTVQ